MFCPSCGSENPDDASFCVNCGKQLGGVAPAPSGESITRPQLGMNDTQMAQKLVLGGCGLIILIPAALVLLLIIVVAISAIFSTGD